MTASAAENITAVILAAGLSSRMGDFKPLLPLREKTIIECAVGLFREAGVEDVLVVAGYEADRLIPVLKRRNARWVVNEHYERGMFSSLQTAVRHLPMSCEAFFVLPSDHPFVRPQTVRLLMSASSGGTDIICRPCCRGRRGHPPLIPVRLVPEILACEEPGGLRTLLSRHEEWVVNVECGDPGIFEDLDTGTDYERVKEKIETKG
jgi:molybdenum cofactor cytidylyltransferase